MGNSPKLQARIDAQLAAREADSNTTTETHVIEQPANGTAPAEPKTEETAELVVATGEGVAVVSSENLAPIKPLASDAATWKTPTPGTASPFAPKNIQHALALQIGTFIKSACSDDNHPVIFMATKTLTEGSTRCIRCVAKLNGEDVVADIAPVLNVKAPAGPTLAEIATLFRQIQTALTTENVVGMPDRALIEAAIVRLEKASVKRSPSTSPTTPRAAGSSTTTATAPVPGGRVVILDQDGVKHNMRYSEGAKLVADLFGDLAPNCVTYKANLADGKQNNARLPLERDLKTGNLPEGTITLVDATGQPVGVSVVQTTEASETEALVEAAASLTEEPADVAAGDDEDSANEDEESILNALEPDEQEDESDGSDE
jgi:hypothetical protein